MLTGIIIGAASMWIILAIFAYLVSFDSSSGIEVDYGWGSFILTLPLSLPFFGIVRPIYAIIKKINKK